MGPHIHDSGKTGSLSNRITMIQWTDTPSKAILKMITLDIKITWLGQNTGLPEPKSSGPLALQGKTAQMDGQQCPLPRVKEHESWNRAPVVLKVHNTR